ncbi:MAG TPA: TonB-dependent receptor [Gemmatimonadaceae bacterium]|jgi:Outer membrane receptor proteins, mostly Fe transport
MRLPGFAWKIALAIGLAAIPRLAAAQGSGTVRGTVTDSSSGQPVVGAQVTITGTTLGTITGENGAYTLRDVPARAVTVRAQRIGFAPLEHDVTLAANDTTTVNFALTAIAAQLSEIVVVGYGTSTRQGVSSAISSVGSEQLANTPSASIESALQGKAPGVQVMENAGNPGNGLSIRVRGPASINAGNQPLYVVDGVPIIQDSYGQLGMGGQDVTAVSGLNPDEIASIDILKDAAASAIYGSRGSNGVVMITTKRGQEGKPKVTFNAYYGRQSNPKEYPLVNAQQYVELYNESAKNDGYDPEDYPFVVGEDDARSFDWQDAIFRDAPISDLQIGLSGGGERTKYYISASRFDQEGIVIGSAYNRIATRLNLDFNPYDKLQLRTSIGLTREDHQRIEGDGSLDGVVTNAIGMQPMRPIYSDDGSYAGRAEGLRYSNPVALASLNSTSLNTLRAMGNVEATYHFTDRVALTGRLGMDVLGLDEEQWESPLVDRTYAASNGGVGKSGHTSVNRYVMESFATVDALRDDRSTLEIIGGASVEHNDSDLNFVRGENFPDGFTKYVRNASIVTEYDGHATENNLVSFFTRANYSLLGRYLLSAGLRADGSSRFGEDSRYGVFPAASVGWVVSDEPFAEGLSRVASLKLRASYGETGNQGIGDFAARALAGGVSYAGTPGSAPVSIANPSLRWENTREFDGGMDLFLFDGRLGVTADYYIRKTSDLLVQRPIALTTGFSSVWDNVGNIENRGIDLSVTTQNFRPSNEQGFGWTTTLNLTRNRNKVTKLFGGQPFTTGINGRETSIVTEGQPLGAFYMYEFQGVDPATGDAIFRDVDGDGELTSADKVIVGDPQPDFFGGLSNEFSLKGFSLRTFLQFSKGADIFNMMRLFTDDGGCTWDNMWAGALDRWQKPGDVTDMPRMSYDCTSGADEISSRYIEDGSYLRIQEVTLSYALPASLLAPLRIENAQIFVSGHNLKTFTDYSGYNPDVNSAGAGANIVMSTDYFAYPIARTFSIGIRGGF